MRTSDRSEGKMLQNCAIRVKISLIDRHDQRSPSRATNASEAANHVPTEGNDG